MVGEPSTRYMPKQSSQDRERVESEKEEKDVSNTRTEDERKDDSGKDEEALSDELEFAVWNGRCSTPKGPDNKVINADDRVDNLIILPFSQEFI